MRRKTIEVEAIKEMVNNYLRESSDKFVGPNAKSIRYGHAQLLGEILHQTGNYKGFLYIQDINSENFDDSRRIYL